MRYFEVDVRYEDPNTGESKEVTLPASWFRVNVHQTDGTDELVESLAVIGDTSDIDGVTAVSVGVHPSGRIAPDYQYPDDVLIFDTYIEQEDE